MIGALIGPGGKNIKRLVEESGCEINIEDDGTVNIFSASPEGMKIARYAINGMTAEAEIGKIYEGVGTDRLRARPRGGQPSAGGSGWVYCTEFLDRRVALDHVAGKSVAVWSHDQAPTHSTESV